MIWNYPVSASGDVRGRVDQTKLASDEAYTLVVCRRSEIIPANPHLAFWVQATWEQPERAFMDSVGHPITATPVDVVGALSLLEGRYTLTNEAAPSVLCWLRDAPVSDATTLRVADAFTIPPRPGDGWCASIELNDGGTIYVQSKQANLTIQLFQTRHRLIQPHGRKHGENASIQPVCLAGLRSPPLPKQMSVTFIYSPKQ